MATKFKLKYLIIAFIIISIITACTAFSVSYAAWVSPTKMTASVGTGKWENKVTNVKDIDWGDIKDGICLNGKVINLEDKFNFGVQVWLDPEENDEVFLKLNGQLITSDNSEFNHHEILGEAYWFNQIADLNEKIVVTRVENGITYKVEFIPSTGSFKFLSGDKFNIYFNSGYLSIVAGHQELSEASGGEIIDKNTEAYKK